MPETALQNRELPGWKEIASHLKVSVGAAQMMEIDLGFRAPGLGRQGACQSDCFRIRTMDVAPQPARNCAPAEPIEAIAERLSASAKAVWPAAAKTL